MENQNRTKCLIYSRIVGYIQPVCQWNHGKQEEFKDRKMFEVDIK
jgi:anaerobic ribonucleoside-triphosphate reductase